MLEPQAPDSLLQWGLFNNAFERKEYMEAYVAGDVAADAGGRSGTPGGVRAAAARAVRRRSSARLEFFYRRHPSWDEQLDLYPVMRVDRAPD